MLQILSALAEITAMLVWIVFIFTVAGAWKNLQLWSQCCLADWLDSWLNFVMAACVFNVTYIGNACSSSPSYSWRKRLALTHIRPPVMSSLLSLISPLVLILFFILVFSLPLVKKWTQTVQYWGNGSLQCNREKRNPSGFPKQNVFIFFFFFFKQSCINREVLFFEKPMCFRRKKMFLLF